MYSIGFIFWNVIGEVSFLICLCFFVFFFVEVIVDESFVEGG